LESDVVFNLPKIKTHAKAGITCALKNMVGINGSKDWLPHHTKGHEAIGGDEYAKESFMKELLSNLIDRRNSNKDFLPSYLFWSAACQYAKILHSFNKRDDGFFEGSWYGNKTIPRTIADLNWILYYADSEGRIATRPIRKVMIIVDGIVAGEGQGPLSPKRKDLGVLIGGVDPISIDYYVAQIMGFNPNRIPTIRYAEMMNLEIHKNGMLEVAVFEGGKQISLENIIDPFEPARGWKGHIETKVGDSELLT
jgi:hypothetical protein